MKKIIITLLVIVLGISFNATTVQADVVKADIVNSDSFDKQVNQMLDQKNFSGTILVVRNGKVLYSTSKGYADKDNKYKNKDNTSYEIDSIQKSLTAALIMKQVELGNLALSDKLSKFYPSVPGSHKITIRQMLDMKSGLILPGDIGPQKVLSDQSIISSDIKRIRFSRALYNNWYYSPINFNLLSGVLEKVTGQSYRHLFYESYIKQLNLKQTEFAYSHYLKSADKSTGYTNIDPISGASSYGHPFNITKFETFDELGTGQVFMSAHDLYKVENYILAGNMLTAASREELFVPASVSNYGGGFYNTYNDHFANGWGYGFQGIVHLSSDGKNAVIVLSNYSRISDDLKPTAKSIFKMVND
ncbi:serine hydrolase domain-containing protein [Companilactobacillus baiquanensis]|uniref:Serine hydrolase domain-containing protein n=1 Tax=Companilactobacillus baiquanensis TaxID=2486005 RepID=A0ABW1UYI5_9LACO|nr:serine hydrolase domain-containing protein [Companilactobacillus baiquanensis]